MGHPPIAFGHTVGSGKEHQGSEKTCTQEGERPQTAVVTAWPGQSYSHLFLHISMKGRKGKEAAPPSHSSISRALRHLTNTVGCKKRIIAASYLTHRHRERCSLSVRHISSSQTSGQYPNLSPSRWQLQQPKPFPRDRDQTATQVTAHGRKYLGYCFPAEFKEGCLSQPH